MPGVVLSACRSVDAEVELSDAMVIGLSQHNGDSRLVMAIFMRDGVASDEGDACEARRAFRDRHSARVRLRRR